MEILTEILEISDRIIETLEEHGFFEENVFVEPDSLKLSLQRRMQRKWEEEEEILLSDKEFTDVCNTEIQNRISQTLSDLVDKGAIDMGVNTDGEIVYSANKNFDINKLNEDE